MTEKPQTLAHRFSLLNEDELSDIHLATLDVLEKTGIFFEDLKALEILHGGGAIINNKKIVKIPPDLIERAVRSCPSKFAVYQRHSTNEIVLGNGDIVFSNFGGAVNVVDPYTGEIRPSTKADLAASATLVDYFEDLVIYKIAMHACDVPQDLLRLHNAEAMLSSTTKPIYMSGGNLAQTKKIINMAAAVVGGSDKLRDRPLLIFTACPISPLKITETTCQIIMECALSKIPLSVTSMAMAGATAPVTLAGALIIHNAQFLAALVLHQLTSQGSPIMYGSVTTSMDLRSSIAPIGSPEISMLSAAVAQLARRYKLPSNVVGGSDSKLSDAQAAHEITLASLLPTLAGANIVSGSGILEAGLTWSFAKLVMDCEFIRMIKYIVQGIPVNDETMALDVINEIGRSKDFLSHDHTLKHMRSSQVHPQLIDRKTRENWEEEGSKDIYQRAHEKAIQILETHKPEPLPNGVQQTLRATIKEAEREFVVSGNKGKRRKIKGGLND